MKLLIFLLAATLVFCPPAYTAMKALDNESLSKVKGSDDDNKLGKDQIAEESETSLERENKLQQTDKPEPSPLDSRLKTLHESSEYKKFIFYLTRLEEFANTDDYSQIASSDKFIFFTSCFAETAKKCHEQLALLADSNTDNNVKSIVNAKNSIFCKADDFYNHLLLYKKGTAPLPDLKGMIDEIKKCQRIFESMSAKMNYKS